MGFRATAIAVVVAVALWGLVLVTGQRQAAAPAGSGAMTLASDPSGITAISVTDAATACTLERRATGWVVREGGTGSATAWPADEQAIRGLLRVLSTAQVSALDDVGERDGPEDTHRRVSLALADGRREMTIAPTRLGPAYAGTLDGDPVRIEAALADALTPAAVLAMRDKAVFDRGGTWIGLTIEGAATKLSLEREGGIWRLAEDAMADVRLDQSRTRTLLETLQTLTFERHVAEPDGFTESGSITITARGVGPDGEIGQSRQRVAIGPQADLAGNAVLLRAERGGASVVGEVLTEQFPALPTEPTPLLDRRALPIDPARVRDLLVRAGERTAPAGALRREGGSWRSEAGIIRRADADLIEAMLRTMTGSDAIPSTADATPAGEPGGLALDVVDADGGRTTFRVSNDEQRVALSDGTVAWRYNGEAALRVADGVRTIRALAELTGTAED